MIPVDEQALRDELRPLLRASFEAFDRGVPAEEAFFQVISNAVGTIARGGSRDVQDSVAKALPGLRAAGASEDLMLNAIIKAAFDVKATFDEMRRRDGNLYGKS